MLSFKPLTITVRLTHLVGLVVVLRVVLEDLLLLFVVEGLKKVVDAAAKLFPPFLGVDEPS